MPRREPLRQQLESFTPADEAEARHRERMLELIAAPGDPFSRGHFTPGHFTASAFVVSPDFRELLLIFHGKFHRWLQPGGHVDPGDEDLAQAARREVLEETGLNIEHRTSNVQHRTPEIPSSAQRSTFDVRCSMFTPFDLDIHPIPPNPKKGEPAHEHFDVRYLFIASDLAHTAGSDAKEAKWVPLDEITAELTDASVMRAVRKLRAIRNDP